MIPRTTIGGACRLLPCAIALAASLLGTAHGAEAAYQLTLIEGGNGVMLSGLNNLGQVVGTAGGASFVWSNGTMTFLGDSSLQASGINAAGTVVGTQLTGAADSAFTWTAGQTSTLPGVGGTGTTRALAINDQGDVAGTSDGRAAVWRNGVAQYLAAPAANAQVAPLDINNQGQVAGTWSSSALLWSNGSATTLAPAATYTSSEARAVNDAGWVAGRSSSFNSKTFMQVGRATVWHDGQTQTLGDMGSLANTYANDINNLGQVVGWATVSTADGGGFPYGAAVPVLWNSAGQATSLVALAGGEPAAQGVLLKVALAINDQGQIAGWGLKNGIQVGFVLTPVPEPSSFALSALGLAAVSAAVARGRARQAQADRLA